MKLLQLLGCALLCLGVCAAEDYPMPMNTAELRARYPLDEAACRALRERGFVVLGDCSLRGLHEAYPRDPQDRYIFVTTDALLQLWHDLSSLPTDDLSILLRCGRRPGALTASYRGVAYICWEGNEGILLALDQATGARLGIAVCPSEYVARVVADDRGVSVTDSDGSTVVYPLKR